MFELRHLVFGAYLRFGAWDLEFLPFLSSAFLLDDLFYRGGNVPGRQSVMFEQSIAVAGCPERVLDADAHHGRRR